MVANGQKSARIRIMVEEEKIVRKEVLDVIERRFQFVIILALFLPFVWSKLQVAAPTMVGHWADNPSAYTGLIISLVFSCYLLFEIFRKIISQRVLTRVATILIVLSYSLIVVISLASVTGFALVGWKLVLLGVAIIGNMLAPIIILAYMVISSLAAGFRRLRGVS